MEILIISGKRKSGLRDCLSGLKKKGLDYFSLTLNPLNALISSGYRKKEELIEEVYGLLTASYESILNYLPTVYADFVKNIALCNGRGKTDIDSIMENLGEAFNERTACRKEDVLSMLEKLSERGLVFVFKDRNGNLEYAVPEELSGILLDGYDPSKNYSSLADYVNALSLFYGIIEVPLLQKLYNRDFNDKQIKDRGEFLEHVRRITAFFPEAVLSGPYLIYSWIFNKADYRTILNEQQKHEPYGLTKEEIESLIAKSSLDEEEASIAGISNFFKSHFDSPVEQILVPFDTVCMIRYGMSSDSILRFLLKNYDFDDTEDILPLLEEAERRLHLWTLNGGRNEAFYGGEDSGDEEDDGDERDFSSLCKIPDEKEIKESKAEFAAYWDIPEEEAPWFRNGDAQIKRIMSLSSRYRSRICLEGNDLSLFFGSYLTALYHKNGNRGGRFGNQKWDFHSFEVLQEARDGVFICIDNDGSIYSIVSDALKIHMEQGILVNAAILVDMGGWYLTYGPVFGFMGFLRSDMDYIARCTASQTYERDGLNGVLLFNPMILLAASSCASMPPVTHKGKLLVNCTLECSFNDNVIPDFPKSWAFEQSGKIMRWIKNPKDYLSSSAVYYDSKTQKVVLHAFSAEDFEKLCSRMKKSITDEGKPLIVSMAAEAFVQDVFKTTSIFTQMEKRF